MFIVFGLILFGIFGYIALGFTYGRKKSIAKSILIGFTAIAFFITGFTMQYAHDVNKWNHGICTICNEKQKMFFVTHHNFIVYHYQCDGGHVMRSLFVLN